MEKELIARAKETGTVEELLALAKENGTELTEEEAKTYFDQLHQKTGELSDEELRLLRLYRKARTLPKERRAALTATLESVISLYLTGEQPKRSRGTD